MPGTGLRPAERAAAAQLNGAARRAVQSADRCGGQPCVLRTSFISSLSRSRDGGAGALALGRLELARLFRCEQPDGHQVERADPAVADPEPAGPVDGVAKT